MSNLNHIRKRHTQLQSPRIIEALNQSLIEEINIYHQAYLNLERPIIQSAVSHPITKYEYPVTFKLQGDLDANIICIMDTYSKKIPEADKTLFQSLYIESMNILIGKIITNLENNFYYSTILSAPIKLKKETLNKIIEEDNINVLKLSTGYKLTYQMQEFDCRILCNIKRQRFQNEV